MRWIRLDLSWSHSQWLSVLAAEARLAWVELLCYVKGYGCDGRVKAMTPDRFARMIYVGEESVRQLLSAAEMHGALKVVGGEWVIVKWGSYQGDETAAERMKRYRANKKIRSDELNEDDNVTDVTRNGRNVTDVTGTETETETETETLEPSKKKACQAPDFVEVTTGRIIAYLNKSAGRQFDPAAGNCKQLHARIREAGAKGADAFEVDARRVIDRKVADWSDSPKMRRYLRPETLFNSEKWPTYREEINTGPSGRHLMTPEEIEQAARDLK